jgi:L-fuconolactonase
MALDFPIVDAHVHFWDPARLRYPWLDLHPEINRPFLVGDFIAACRPYTVDTLVYLQSDCLPEQHLDELRWVQALSESEPRLRGFVPWAPLDEPAALEESLRAVAGEPRVRGVRRIIQLETDPSFCLKPGFLAGIAKLEERALHFELTVNPAQLPSAAELARRFPNMRFLLDHIGNPDIRRNSMEPWATDLRALARMPNVWCKISSLPVNASRPWTIGMLKPYIDTVIAAFGWERVMFAGDWPNLLRAASYAEWVDAIDRATGRATSAQRCRLFRVNALSFYRLG